MRDGRSGKTGRCGVCNNCPRGRWSWNWYCVLAGWLCVLMTKPQPRLGCRAFGQYALTIGTADHQKQARSHPQFASPKGRCQVVLTCGAATLPNYTLLTSAASLKFGVLCLNTWVLDGTPAVPCLKQPWLANWLWAPSCSRLARKRQGLSLNTGFHSLVGESR